MAKHAGSREALGISAKALGIVMVLLFVCGCSEKRTDARAASAEHAGEDGTAGHPRAVNVAPQQGSSTLTIATDEQQMTDTASVRGFVQRFYDWYAPMAAADNHTPPWYRVLQSRDTLLSIGLRLGLRADSARQAHMAGEVTELNFDPFLASQDACRRYQVRNVRKDTAGYSVTVHPVCSAKRTGADVLLVVAPRGESWEFSNFFYDGTDLRSLLCQSAREGDNSRELMANLDCDSAVMPRDR